MRITPLSKDAFSFPNPNQIVIEKNVLKSPKKLGLNLILMGENPQSGIWHYNCLLFPTVAFIFILSYTVAMLLLCQSIFENLVHFHGTVIVGK